jgi:uncharacterized membrane protein YidH (DUF202 family)
MFPDAREHQENESTFLAWYSAAGGMIMLAIACTAGMQAKGNSPHERRVWRALTVCFYMLAIGLVGLGASRFFRQQHAISHGLVVSGGIELTIFSGAILSALILVLAVVLTGGGPDEN